MLVSAGLGHPGGLLVSQGLGHMVPSSVVELLEVWELLEHFRDPDASCASDLHALLIEDRERTLAYDRGPLLAIDMLNRAIDPPATAEQTLIEIICDQTER